MFNSLNYKSNLVHLELNSDGNLLPRKYKSNPARGIFNVHFLNGAGYKKGFTFYIAFNLKNHYDDRKLIQFGITSNPEKLPYVDI